MKTPSRTKKTLMNVIASFLLILVNTAFGIYVSYLVLSKYGPDYYGLNATILQVLIVLQIIEGGFYLAVNVAMYKPAVEKDEKTVNAIYYKAKKIFNNIALCFFCTSVATSLLFGLFINTSVPYYEVVLLFLFTSLPTALNMAILMKIQCVYAAHQQEYITQFISVFLQIIIGCLSIVLVRIGIDYLHFRMTAAIIGLLIIPISLFMFKKTHPNVHPKKIENMPVIRGTKDVLVLKICSVVYTSLPIVFIALFFNTVVAGIYGVYAMVINMLRQLLNSIAVAPMSGFGQIIAENDRMHIKKQFWKFNLLVIVMATLFLSVTMTMILPFVSIYTGNVGDVNYIKPLIAILLISINFIGFTHIPSGIIMQASGSFVAAKNISLAVTILIIVLCLFGIITFGINGLLIGLLICALVLAVSEISYVHIKMKWSVIRLCFFVAVNASIFVFLCVCWYFTGVENMIDSIATFIFWGGIVFITNAIIICIINYLFFRKEVVSLVLQFIRIIRPRNEKKIKGAE